VRILALYAATNQHGNDAKGAFVPESSGFAKARKAHGDVVDRVAFANGEALASKRRASVLASIANATPFEGLAYFGHGLRSGLPSAGFTMQTIDALADAIDEHATKGAELRIVLYACSAAGAPGRDRDRLDGDGGFADVLRDKLAELGRVGWIDAHTVAGHATINRYARRFRMNGKGAGVGGAWLVEPGSPDWPAWGARLKSDPDFRFGFPFLSEAEILATLRAKP